jgi:hypothetical protein
VHNGWPFLVLGTDQCLDGNHFVHSMIPIAFAFVRSEPQAAYDHLLGAYPAAMLKYFDVEERINVVEGLCGLAF